MLLVRPRVSEREIVRFWRAKSVFKIQLRLALDSIRMHVFQLNWLEVALITDTHHWCHAYLLGFTLLEQTVLADYILDCETVLAIFFSIRHFEVKPSSVIFLTIQSWTVLGQVQVILVIKFTWN